MIIKLELCDVIKSFENGSVKRPVLSHVSVAFEQGKTYALVGASGSGKSTLMHLVAGLDTPSQGNVLLDGKDMVQYTARERAHRVVLVTQVPFLIKELTVIENVAVAGLVLGMSQPEVRERALYYLEAVGLFETRDWKVGALSGGQRQRACVARALLVRPQFLCADEPTGALDAKTGQAIITLLLEHQQKEGIGLIISSHNPAVVEQMEVVFALKDGILMPRHQSVFQCNQEAQHERSAA